MTLDQLVIGQSAVVTVINCDDITLRKHILDMGLTTGTEVTYVREGSGVMEIRLRGYELALRKVDAGKIEISNITDEERVYSHPHAERIIEQTKSPGLGEAVTEKSAVEHIPEGDPLTIAIIGNSNCGKTTLFNHLSTASQHQESFSGVDIDFKCANAKGYSEVKLVDLPGVYALTHFTKEETATRDFILNAKPECIINIIDASNFQRNFYLTTQLLSMEVPMVIALNMMDEVRKNNGSIDINLVESLLGVPVIPISAINNQGLEELMEHAIFVARHNLKPRSKTNTEWADNNIDIIHKCLRTIMSVVVEPAKKENISVRFAATKLIEGDEPMRKRLRLGDEAMRIIQEATDVAEKEAGTDCLTLLAEMRFRFINMLYARTVVYPTDSIESRRSKKFDDILTGKYTAIPAFVAIMASIFYVTFGPLGSWLSDTLSIGIDGVIAYCDEALTDYGINSVVHSLIVDGALAGIGSILGFMPIIVLLFFFLALLEDSGYISRVAFVMDSLLRKIGLSGRSIVPMLIGFGCSTPAIMSSRTLPSERDRKMTIMLIPFMNCSAKLPVYALLTAVFFPGNGPLVMTTIYFGSIIVGIIFALILKKTVFKGEPVPFVMELPNYRIPAAKNVLQIIGEQVEDFITKAFTVIFAASVIIWFLQTFDAHFNLVEDSTNSLLSSIGGVLAPVFAPLGLGDWRIATALIAGFSAKESVVSTLLVLVGGTEENLHSLFTTASVIVFICFFNLYTPCVSAVAATKRELGGKWASILIFCQCGIAWVVSFVLAIFLRMIGIA